jgi:hypothetical protein
MNITICRGGLYNVLPRCEFRQFEEDKQFPIFVLHSPREVVLPRALQLYLPQGAHPASHTLASSIASSGVGVPGAVEEEPAAYPKGLVLG